MKKYVFYIMISLVAVVVAALRVVQFAFFYSSETGFFTDSGILSAIALVIIVVATAVIGIKIRGEYRQFSGEGNKASGVLTLLSGVIGVISCYIMYDEYIYMIKSSITDVSSMGFSFRVPFMVTSLIFSVLCFVYSYSFFVSGAFFQKAKIFPMVSVIWAITLILYVFVHYSISVLITENIFVIFSACLLALALLNCGKFVSGYNNYGTLYRGMMIYSIGAYLMTGAYSLSGIVLNLMNISIKHCPPLEINLIMLSGALCTAAFSFLASSKETQGPPKEIAGKRFVSGKKGRNI